MLFENPVAVHVLWRETLTRLETLLQRIEEGQDVQASVDFARYLHWSGLLNLLESHTTKEPLPVDGALVRAKAKALETRGCELLAGSGDRNAIHETQFESINRKLDLIAGHVAQFAPRSEPQVSDSPALPAAPALVAFEAAKGGRAAA